MTLSNHIRGFAIAALLTTASPTYLHAQSWETVDAFQLPGLDWCQALNLAVDSSGRLFVAGRGFASGASRGSVAVRRSNDQGLTWQTVFTLEEQSHSIFSTFKVFSGTPGKMLITTGIGSLVYRSEDGGDSWATVDDFVLAPGLPTYVGPEGLATTPHGLFAVGSTDYVWKVWRSTNNGTTWSTVDSFRLGWGSVPRGIAADASGNLFVVGYAMYNSAPTRWMVRRSSDGGNSWTTVDNYVSATGNHTTAYAVTVDNAGRLWVAGEDVGSWLVRRSDDLGAHWVNSDVFLIPGRFPAAISLAADAAGNVFAAGYGGNPGNELHAEFWMVRKLAAPPRLATEAANGSLQLTWPTNASSFVFQSATTLSNGGDWQNSNLTPAVVDDQNAITVGTTTAAAFYRLHQP